MNISLDSTKSWYLRAWDWVWNIWPRLRKGYNQQLNQLYPFKNVRMKTITNKLSYQMECSSQLKLTVSCYTWYSQFRCQLYPFLNLRQISQTQSQALRILMKSVNRDQIQKQYNSIGIMHLGRVTFTVIVMESTFSLLPLGSYLLPPTMINIVTHWRIQQEAPGTCPPVQFFFIFM